MADTIPNMPMWKYKVLAVGVVLCGVIIAVAVLEWNGLQSVFWDTSRPSPASFDYLRVPVIGEKKMYETTWVWKFPDKDQRFEIQGEEGGLLEVGLRKNVEHGEPREYVFAVYEQRRIGRRKLLEKSGFFPSDFWFYFRTDRGLKGRTGGKTEITYELKPKDLKERFNELFDSIKGAPPVSKGFEFRVPGVMNPRRSDDINIILLSFDTMRADRLGCMGYPLPTTPHIDAFTKRGVLFTEAISSSSWTLPAHASLMTGLYPSAQLTGTDDVRRYKNHVSRPLAELLKGNGYYTMAVTAGLHVTSANGFAQGFDRYIEFSRRSSRESTARIFQTASQWLDTNAESKFFLFLHHYECHDPYKITQFSEDQKAKGFIDERRARYDGGVWTADVLFGKFLKKLESLDLLSNTAIILVSDHGEDLYDHITHEDVIPPNENPVIHKGGAVDHGHTLYDEVVKIPMIFYFPGLRPKRNVIENQVSIIDVKPTILEYLDIPLDKPVQGTSLLSLMIEGDRAYDPPAISEYMLSGPSVSR